MHALWIENRRLSLRQNLTPTSVANGVEVNTVLAGICGTDLELLRGYYNFVGVPGHEFVGTVAAGPRKGQRVVADINLGCGYCYECHHSQRRHCSNRQVIGIKAHSGAFADSIVIPETNLIPVPDSVPDWQAAQAEPLAAALQILEQVPITGQSVLLVGFGRLGRMVARVIETLKPQTSLTICRRGDSVQPQKFDIAIDCTGHQTGFEIALQGLKPMGTLVVKSTYADHLTLDMSRIVVDEITLVGSRCGPMDKAIDYLAEGRIKLPEAQHEYYDLTEFERAFARAKDRSVEKVFFQF